MSNKYEINYVVNRGIIGWDPLVNINDLKSLQNLFNNLKSELKNKGYKNMEVSLVNGTNKILVEFSPEPGENMSKIIRGIDEYLRSNSFIK